MKTIEEKKQSLENWKVVLLVIGAISTFLTFFIPFVSSREQQMDQSFSQTLQRLGDENQAIRASAAMDMEYFYHYRRFFGLGKHPYSERVAFILPNSLLVSGNETFVRQAILQAINEIDPEITQGIYMRGADLHDLDLRNTNFTGTNLAWANISGAYGEVLSSSRKPVSFENAVLFEANFQGVAFEEANMRGALLESAHLTNSWFVNADFTDAFLWRADLSNAHFCSPSNSQFWETSFENAVLDEAILSGTQFCHTNLTGASLLNITLWDEQTNFADSNCDGVKFDKSSDFYIWGHAKFPSCFK